MEHPIPTAWDDLLKDINSPEDWQKKNIEIKKRFNKLLRMEAAPEIPADLQIKIENEWLTDGFRVKYVSYNVEEDERAHAYLAIPDLVVPAGGFPGVVCIHGTTNWGARRTLGIPPDPNDPQKHKSMTGLDCARNLVRKGFVTISPEHFCCASRTPAEGPFDTAAFYRKHPNWSAVGKATYENSLALSVLASQPEVNAGRVGATGNSLGGHGSIWLGAYDERVKCVVASCPGGTFRENNQVLEWSRTKSYIYLPQLREQLLAGKEVECDFHEMMALIAPRPCLEMFALNDTMCGSTFLMNEHKVMLHLRLAELYHLLGQDGAHAFLVFGDGHQVPDLSRAATLSFMERWLKYDGNPFGGWDSRLHKPG